MGERAVNLAQDSPDLTARSRIRNAALELYAANGEDRVSMRAVAAAAGVTVGLVQHHFGTKDGLRTAVEQSIVDAHAQAIASVPDEGDPAALAAARDAAVAQMLAARPVLVDYLRRSVCDIGTTQELLARLTELARSEVADLRAAGRASRTRPESVQVVEVMIRQLGHLLLQPMLDAMWAQLDPPASVSKPTLQVTVATERRAP